MSNGEDWIDRRVDDAKKVHTVVTDAVTIRIKQLLCGHLGDRQLRSTELASLAKTLLSYMTAVDKS